MAGIIRNSLIFAAKRIVTPNASKIFCPSTSTIRNPLVSTGVFSRNVTRSLWYMSNRHETSGYSKLTTRAMPSHRCSCGCQIHTEVDEALSKFLEKEIKQEKSSDSSRELPKLHNFVVSKSEGSHVELVSKIENETITIKVNVNDSVMSESSEESENEDRSEEMVSKPNFTVELDKSLDYKLIINCCFPDGGYQPEDGEEKIDDQFEILDISVCKGDLQDSTYSVDSETMDATLYDLMMDMLDERNISNEFAQNLVNFCTVYEHGNYVNFLQDLKSFVDK